MSPHIITTSLKTVQDWTEVHKDEVSSEEGNPLTIKSNPTTGEITVTYPIGGEDDLDTHPCTITITLPSSFPLTQATVSSPTNQKTTFDEKRWRSWLRSAQGFIAFNNNNIIDGVLAWRKNIVGALQGKSECCICYGLIAEDGKLPTKKCRTCKNAFHALCLGKWFSSSGSSRCPLCRTEFVGGRKGGRSGVDGEGG
jgi:hypothetical protein